MSKSWVRPALILAAALSLGASGAAVGAAPEDAAGTGMVVTPQDPGTASGVSVAVLPGTPITRRPNNVIEMSAGALLVFVRAPAEMSTVVTPLGNASIAAPADALVAVAGGVIKVQSLRGEDESVTVILDRSQFSHMDRTVLPIAPGRELVARSNTAPGAQGGAVASGQYVVGESNPESLRAAAAVVALLDDQAAEPDTRRLLQDVGAGPLLHPYSTNERAPARPGVAGGDSAKTAATGGTSPLLDRLLSTAPEPRAASSADGK